MNTTAALRRLERDIIRQGGDKKLLDANVAIVRGMIDAQAASDTTTVWWDEYGPDRDLSRRARQLVDFVVVNGGATEEQIAAALGINEDNARKLVKRADDQLLERGGKATISWDGRGVARTATTSVVVCSFSPPTR